MVDYVRKVMYVGLCKEGCVWVWMYEWIVHFFLVLIIELSFVFENWNFIDEINDFIRHLKPTNDVFLIEPGTFLAIRYFLDIDEIDDIIRYFLLL